MKVSRDCILGCIVGGAIGDALGGLGERAQLTISDDTQLTIATCEAIQKVGQVSPAAVAECFLRWFRGGAITGLGSSTLKSLRDLDAGAHWALCGARGERAAGNGAAMRIAPLAFVLDSRDDSQRVTIRDVCRITHHHDEAYLGALAVLLAIQCPVWLPPFSLQFNYLAEALPDSCVRDRLIAFSELAANEPLPSAAARFGSSGYVAETVPLAIFVASRLTSGTFEPTMAELAGFCDDADTIGSIAGQIAGAHLGFSQLPQHLLETPAVRPIIPFAEAFAARLAAQNAAT